MPILSGKHKEPHMRFMTIALFVVLGWACEAMAHDGATAYPRMAPLNQYLMEMGDSRLRNPGA